MVVVAKDCLFFDELMGPFARHTDLTPPAVNRKTVVVVSGLANIHARVLGPLDDTTNEKSVLFGQKATASQLYNAISYLYKDYSSPDSFNLVLMYKDKEYPLKFENKPIPNLDLEPSQAPLQGFYAANIGVNQYPEIVNGDTHKIEKDTSHKTQIESTRIESPLKHPKEFYLMDVVPSDSSPLNARSFLVSSSTVLEELYNNIIFVGASRPTESTIRLHYSTDLFGDYTENVLATTQLFSNVESLRKTLGKIDFEFNRPNQILSLELMLNLSESKPVLPAIIMNDLFNHQEESSPASPKFVSILAKMKMGDEARVEAQDFQAEAKSEMVYVGLVNQAMTCYLNSLLQALYMTPEFRNALYNWEFVDGTEKDKASNSIPYQLQKLFLNLQTSTKTAVETTSLTKSFGWDSTEAWQQHDIQELCRVMFDALEQKFQNTQQADLINRLYEGKMIDYVKCLECRTEKSREDTFLDIPLPVKPFGSNVAYNSVEEALRAFVQPETLDGTNQYFCETCNKKCDAHKGLKFSKFPYLLTLHLKRFDFDNNTFHRIKLNDRVSFPDVLNLNSFVPSDNQESPTAEEDAGVGVKGDDGSTTDSGGLDECPLNSNGINENGITSEPSSEHLNNHEQDDSTEAWQQHDDEGIDMSNGPSTSTTEHSQEDTRHQSASGPYVYELFSIMIHSGSASGGHYYAYIKDFRTNEWLCFNDQNVTPITDEDIQKTYGGGPTRGYYSGAYSSSTNAYMLMYRQIDSQRNCLPMEVDNFPNHIQDLLVKMKEHEEERKPYDRPAQMYRIKIYVRHPVENTMKSRKLFSVPDETLAELTEKAWKALDLENVVDLEQCRLATYDVLSATIDSTFDDQEQEPLGIILQEYSLDMLLEIRKKEEQFEQYEPGGLGTRVFHIDCVEEKIIDGPIYVRGYRAQTVKQYKEQVGEILNINPDKMVVVLQKYPSGVRVIMNNGNQLVNEGFLTGVRVFVMDKTDNNLAEFIDKFETLICLDVELPDTSEEVLEELGIQSLESRQRELKELKEQKELKEAEKIDNQKKKSEVGEASQQKEESRDQASNSCPEASACDNEEWQEQSNSEDSSLSDSDRTLVGNASEDDEIGLVTVDDEWYRHSKSINEKTDWDMDHEEEMGYIFKATPYDKNNQKHLRVIVDKRMKFCTFRKHLEPFVGVPMESFKVLRQALDTTDVDYMRPTSSLRIWDDEEKISIKLGRALRSHEFRVKVFVLDLENSSKSCEALFEATISKDATVGAVKKQLLAELQRKHGQSIDFEQCRLRKKDLQNPSKVLLNEQKIRDVGFMSQPQLFIQEWWEGGNVTSTNQILVMVARVSMNDQFLGSFQEIVLDEKSYEELAKKIMALSMIRLENLQLTKGKWPCNLYETRLYWTPANPPLQLGTLEDGSCILYRDRDDRWSSNFHGESTGDCDFEKRRSKSSARFRLTSRPKGPRGYKDAESPRREKALKIYLDDK
ncbi:ubiquitin carboxyl-terminal hydrolase 47 [Fopius arisanus]|uniref:Ubiquitin carboxyl-terminal hydrolase 47 n=1 Tax=Fopius arisanus TaxID=64838 RepID=A0A9R1TU66_9HYME|nr:PREDICTED: ubiquitin carboxyl-terminal hydrolase 47 [Fopius arisanus]